MDSYTLRTSVDELYELIKAKKKMTIEEAAKLLNLPLPVVHSLVDFLVEEKVFGIEYKFTTPYVYFNKEKEEAFGSDQKPMITKELFFAKAKQRNLAQEKIHELWHRYLEENMDKIREDFYTKSYRKNLPKQQIDSLWNQYLTYLR